VGREMCLTLRSHLLGKTNRPGEATTHIRQGVYWTISRFLAPPFAAFKQTSGCTCTCALRAQQLDKTSTMPLPRSPEPNSPKCGSGRTCLVGGRASNTDDVLSAGALCRKADLSCRDARPQLQQSRTFCPVEREGSSLQVLGFCTASIPPGSALHGRLPPRTQTSPDSYRPGRIDNC
jgi:hypothetical protein